MLLAGKPTKTHYEILYVKEDASYDEIRANYKAAILSSHPDKMQMKADVLKVHNNLKQDFLDIQKAWEVLSDTKCRADYDNELRALREVLEVVASEVELGDMIAQTVGDDVQELFYQCRCGDYFSITSLELKEMGISLDMDVEVVVAHSTTDSAPTSVLLPCGSCSTKLRLMIDFDS